MNVDQSFRERTSARRTLALDNRAENDPQDDGNDRKFTALQNVADHPEGDGDIHGVHIFGRREGANCGQDQHERKQPGAVLLQNENEQSDRAPGDQKHENGRNQKARQNSVDEIGIGLEQHHARFDAVQYERAKHDGRRTRRRVCRA